MLEILIVEDHPEKLKLISKALSTVDGVNIERINHVVDGLTARKLLRDKHFDLLILDIVIPPRIDQKVDSFGGLKLLKEIIEWDIYNVPSHIIGITRYKDIYVEVEKEFNAELLTILYYEPSSDDVFNKLRSKVGIISSSKLGATSAIQDYSSHLGIICATEKPELEAVLKNGWSWNKLKFTNEETDYYQTRLDCEESIRIVHAAASPRMGMPDSAILATKMILRFRPKYICMCGICAGYKDSTELGDVLVADPVWDWENGKWIEKRGNLEFLPEPHQLPLDGAVRSKMLSMAKEEDLLLKIRKGWQGNCPDHDLSIRVGPIASGASVVADGGIRKLIRKQHRKAMGIEMESYSIYAAAYEATFAKPIAFSAKSVVDFGDRKKGDSYHKYAAYTSAQVIRYFVEKYL